MHRRRLLDEIRYLHNQLRKAFHHPLTTKNSIYHYSLILSEFYFILVVAIAHCLVQYWLNIFLIFHILLLFHSRKGSLNNLKNLRNSENIFHIAFAIARWQLLDKAKIFSFNTINAINIFMTSFFTRAIIHYNVIYKSK